jgi:hypothetical protein
MQQIHKAVADIDTEVTYPKQRDIVGQQFQVAQRPISFKETNFINHPITMSLPDHQTQVSNSPHRTNS